MAISSITAIMMTMAVIIIMITITMAKFLFEGFHLPLFTASGEHPVKGFGIGILLLRNPLSVVVGSCSNDGIDINIHIDIDIDVSTDIVIDTVIGIGDL